MKLFLNGKNHAVATIGAAPKLVDESSRKGGSTRWYSKNPGGARVIDENGTEIGTISYNARWWPNGITWDNHPINFKNALGDLN